MPGMGYTQYDEYTSGRREVEKLLNENPHLSFKALKQKLRQNNIPLEDQTVRNYMSRHRVYSQNGLVPQSHNGLGHLVVGFGVEMWESAPAWGWKASENRNRCRRICRLGVTLFWYRDGVVQFRFKGSRRESDLMGAFSQAFWHVLLGAGNCERGLADFLRALFKVRYRQGRVERTFDVGGPMPRFKIEYYKKSRGLVFKTDGSHDGLEVEEGTPVWVGDVKIAVQKGIQEGIEKAAEMVAGPLVEATKSFKEEVIAPLTEQIQSHLDLIETWKRENENQRQAASVDPCARCSKRILHGYQETQVRLFSRCDGQRCSHV
jgi:hypothetical protein